jgi:hypothetical protein
MSAELSGGILCRRPSNEYTRNYLDPDTSMCIFLLGRNACRKFDPIAASSPVNLTVNGRKEQITYSLIQLDREKRAYNTSEAQYLTGFNERTKGSGYYTTRLNKPVAPKALLAGNFKLAALAKAKDANAVIYTQETYEQYPDIQLSNLSFKKSIRLTDGIRQQDSIIWGTAELTSWISLDGRPLEGVIYKPADFDPNKKYPVIVNFYERNANTLYNYHMPVCIVVHDQDRSGHLIHIEQGRVFNVLQRHFPDIAPYATLPVFILHGTV